jgi:hypothetical protein
MKCYPENTIIQRVGLDIIYSFIRHNIEINDFSNHAPSVLVAALNIHDDNTSVHSTYANVVLKLASPKTDPINPPTTNPHTNINNNNNNNQVKSLLIKYGVHNGLGAILRKRNADISCTCLLALQALAAQPTEACHMIINNESIIHAILYALDSHPHDICILMEGIRSLLKFEITPEYRKVLEQTNNHIIFKKTRKSISVCSKEPGKYIEYYTKQELMEVLGKTNKSNCIII